MTTPQQEPQPIKTISIEATRLGETSYDFTFFEDGSFQILPIGDEIFHTELFLAPHQVATLIEELRIWAMGKVSRPDLGAKVRRTWVEIKQDEVRQGKEVKADHLLPYEKLDPYNQWIDNCIGEDLLRFFFLSLTVSILGKKQEE